MHSRAWEAIQIHAAGYHSKAMLGHHVRNRVEETVLVYKCITQEFRRAKEQYLSFMSRST